LAQERRTRPPYLTTMLTSTCAELDAAMNSVGGERRRGVQRRQGDAIVVLAVGGTELAAWPLAGSAQPDLTVIDTLARLALAARHVGGGIALRNAGPGLLALIDFVGLDDVLVTDGSPGAA
jgi:hypothetical protein